MPKRALPNEEESYLSSPETSRFPLSSLRQGRKIFCPHCEEWAPSEAFIALQTPHRRYAHVSPPIVKHGGVDGCKRLFSIAEEE